MLHMEKEMIIKTVTDPIWFFVMIFLWPLAILWNVLIMICMQGRLTKEEKREYIINALLTDRDIEFILDRDF